MNLSSSPVSRLDTCETSPNSGSTKSRRGMEKTPGPTRGLVHLITLGCARNRVDSEVMLGTLSYDGWSYCDDPASADLIVVNTCGFIEAAKEESIDRILEMAEYKKYADVTLVVAGCLTQRYKSQLVKSLPEVDLFVGSDQFAYLWTHVGEFIDQKNYEHADQDGTYKKALKGDGKEPLSSAPPKKLYAQRSGALYTDFMPRINTLHSHSAYVKVAEGCDHQCAFCIIPAIRGRLRSRTIDSVVRECQDLACSGVKEVNLIAQDLAAYGRDDASNSASLVPLLRGICEVEGIAWVRLLYMYPERIKDEFLDLMACEPKLLPYLDIPMQHGHSDVLKRMNRGVSGPQLREIIASVRECVPGISLRTSVMVGFPGESEDEFRGLYNFVKDMRFDHLGCFVYSPESGTVAGAMRDQVEPEVKQVRQQQIMELQSKISAEKLAQLRGQKTSMLIEKELTGLELSELPRDLALGMSNEGLVGSGENSAGLRSRVWRGRLSTQAPEVDGYAYCWEILNEASDRHSHHQGGDVAGDKKMGQAASALAIGDIISADVVITSTYDLALAYR